MIRNFRWIVLYDNVEEIRNLYENYFMKEYFFNYFVFSLREGKEVLFFSDNELSIDLEDKNFVFFRYGNRSINKFKGFYYKEIKKKKKSF